MWTLLTQQSIKLVPFIQSQALDKFHKPRKQELQRALEQRRGDEQRADAEDEEEQQVELDGYEAAVFEQDGFEAVDGSR